MPKTNFFNHNRILIFSLIIFLATLILAIFIHHPPRFPNLLFSNKPGILTLRLEDNIQVSKPFQVTVSLDTNKQNINAAGVYLKYDPRYLILLDLDTRSSFCQFYPEKKFDNNLGTVSLSCGSPHPGISGENNLMILTFMPQLTGTTTIITDSHSRLLLSNGKGTNILQEFPSAKITILNSL